MLRNGFSMSDKFSEDQAIIFVTFGGFGRYVLYLLHEEFRRLHLPGDKVRFLAFDTEQPHRDGLDLDREAEYLIHLGQFDGDLYIDNEETKELKNAVNHIPTNLFRDIEGGCKGVPAVGFVAFHKYDDLVITKHAYQVIDDVRAKNPGKKVKMIIISGMGGSVSNGMTIPFLYRIRSRLREKKIRVEVHLATSEGYLGLQNILEDSLERNCVASAMLWEYAMAGRNGLLYPGKNGVRTKEIFDGKIAHRVYIYSGGAAETSLKYQEIASTIAKSISTLETTKVGSYLDGDRVNYAGHILEREWHGTKGAGHQTGLMTMNVVGLKGDGLPQIFHYDMVGRVIDDIAKELPEDDAEKIRSRAISTFLENDLNEDDLLRAFPFDTPTLTRETVNESSVPRENIYEFLKTHIDEIKEKSAEEYERHKKNDDTLQFVEQVITHVTEAGNEISLTPGNYLNGGVLFYRKFAALVDDKIKKVSESISKVEHELIEGVDQEGLDNLLDKLATVCKKKMGIGDIAINLGGSPTISLVNEIIDAIAKIQHQKSDKYKHLLLLHIYSSLFKFAQEQQEALKAGLYKCTKMRSELDHEIDMVKRIGCSTISDHKQEFDELTHHLMEQIYPRLDVIPTHEVIEQLGLPVAKDKEFDETEYLDKLLQVVRPDLNQLTKFVDEVIVNDKKAYDYLKSVMGQFYMTLEIDRDRFPTLETSQACFVVCTTRFYEKYKDELFEGYTHLETQNPFNIIVTKHEEGFPFAAISYMHRINEDFKEMRTLGKSAEGTIMADLDNKLPLLDD